MRAEITNSRSGGKAEEFKVRERLEFKIREIQYQKFKVRDKSGKFAVRQRYGILFKKLGIKKKNCACIYKYILDNGRSLYLNIVI